MELSIAITIGIILLVVGLVSCVLPPLPGPPIAYLALVLIYFVKDRPADLPLWLMITYAVLTIIVLIVDNFIPIWGTKQFGGTKAGIRGSFIGILVGIFLSPFGGISILLCPFLGAMIGELFVGQPLNVALKSGMGSFIGFLLTSGLKIILVVFMGLHFFKAAF